MDPAPGLDHGLLTQRFMAVEAEELNPSASQHSANPAQFPVTTGVKQISGIILDAKGDPQVLNCEAFSKAALFDERQLGALLEFRK